MNGEVLPDDDARVSVFDHGLVVGDGVFETIKVASGVPFAMTRHLVRLRKSANQSCAKALPNAPSITSSRRSATRR